MGIDITFEELLKLARVPVDPRRCLERQELGDAEMFRDRMRDLVLFDHTEQRWYRWNGLYWRPDLDNELLNLLPNTLIAEYRKAETEARSHGDRDLTKRFGARAADLGDVARVRSVLAFAASLNELKLVGDEWQVPVLQLPVANGIVDLATGSLRAGKPHDRIRLHAPSEYFGFHHPAPLWDRLLSDVFGGDAEMIGYFRRLIGYAISGARTEQILPVLYGVGANGKSTIVDALSFVLGRELTFHTQPEALQDTGKVDGNAARPFVASFRDKRLILASESRDGARLNAGLIKQLTGDDLLTARKLYSEPQTFEQTYTVMLITNHRPSIPDGSDEALWRRLQLVPFEQRFVDDPKLPNEHKRERDLGARLKTEASGILAWAVRGAMEYLAGGLNPPAAVLSSTAEYRADEDVIGQFVEACLTVEENLELQSGIAYRTYLAWCEESGQQPVSATSFGKAMAARYGRSISKKIGHRVLRVYRGVGGADSEVAGSGW